MKNERLYVPALGPVYEKIGKYIHLIMRVGLAIVLFRHGWTKLFDPEGNFALTTWVNDFATSDMLSFIPGIFVFAWLIVLIETVGALFLAIGLHVRLVAVSFFIFMCFAMVLKLPPEVTWPWGFRPIEKEFILAFLALYFIAFGAGNHSLDNKLKKVF